jgi:V8-like Glu-specific endopeptidase
LQGLHSSAGLSFFGLFAERQIMKSYLVPTLIVIFLIGPISTEEKGDSYRGLASAWTIIPSRSLAGLHYLFKGYTINEEKNLVQVTGPVVEITDGESLAPKVFRDGFMTELDLEDFEEIQDIGRSVFEATTGSGTSVGTAFLVGKDVVLTNRHVMSIRPLQKVWPCGKFAIKLNHRDESVACKKVLFCSSKFDYCVVKMNALSDGRPLDEEVRPLRLVRNVRPHKDQAVLHIGNAAGFGVQASRGVGLSIKDGEFFHFAPTLGGSSGAPIFNQEKNVIGINWGHTGDGHIDERAFNRGILSDTIFKELKEKSSETLKSIKSFRSWYHRIFAHRKAKVIESESSKGACLQRAPGSDLDSQACKN